MRVQLHSMLIVCNILLVQEHLKMRSEEPDQVRPKISRRQTSSKNSAVTINVTDNNTPNAWNIEDEEDQIEPECKNNGTNQQWPLGRLEEYKALHSSIRWMMFDIGIDLQDVLFKCAGKGFKTF